MFDSNNTKPTSDSEALNFIKDTENIPIRFWLNNLVKNGVLECWDKISDYEYKITFKE